MTTIKLSDSVNEYQNEGTFINEVDEVTKTLFITLNFGGDWDGITNYDTVESWKGNVQPLIEENISEELQDVDNTFHEYAGYKIVINSIIK